MDMSHMRVTQLLDEGLWTKTPDVSIAIGTKWWLEPRRAYFWVYAFSAWLATSPTSLAARAT